MKNGYRVLWTDNALEELENTLVYLEKNWTNKEISHLLTNLEKLIRLISENPFIFQEVNKKKGIRRAVLLSLNSVIFRVSENDVEILSFFANRKSPNF